MTLGQMVILYTVIFCAAIIALFFLAIALIMDTVRWFIRRRERRQRKQRRLEHERKEND